MNKIQNTVNYRNRDARSGPGMTYNERTPNIVRCQGFSKNRSYLLSHLVGQYHRRW